MARNPEKAVIQNLDTDEKIEVMFNPTRYTSTSKLVTCASSAGVQFQTVTDPEFTVELFFDTYEDGTDVRKKIKPIADLQEPTQGAGDKRDPPTCMFSWGGFHFTGLVSSLSQTFTLFLPSGVPARADVTITFISILTAREMMENAGLDNCRKLRLVRESSRLDNLAAQATGSPANWRTIAAANGVEDPLAFPTVQQVGRYFIIPDAGETA